MLTIHLNKDVHIHPHWIRIFDYMSRGQKMSINTNLFTNRSNHAAVCCIKLHSFIDPFILKSKQNMIDGNGTVFI